MLHYFRPNLVAYRAIHVIAFERMALSFASTSVLFAGGLIDPVWLIVMIDVIGIDALAAEHYRIAKRPGNTGLHHSHA